MVTIYNTPLSATSEKALFGRPGGEGFRKGVTNIKARGPTMVLVNNRLKQWYPTREARNEI